MALVVLGVEYRNNNAFQKETEKLVIEEKPLEVVEQDDSQTIPKSEVEEDSKPKIFKLRDIIENGNNIGRKVAEWKPTIAPTHPYCRCTLVHKPKNMDWDETTHAFTKVRKITSKKVGDISKYIKITR